MPETVGGRIHAGEVDDLAARLPVELHETLREAVGEREFLDVTAQLPAEFATDGARP